MPRTLRSLEFPQLPQLPLQPFPKEGCGDHSQKPALDTATNSIESRQRAEGSRSVTFITPFFYGDKVQFDSVNGKGIGLIDGIVLAKDGSVCYEVQDVEKKLEDGQLVIRAGIYPDEITLIERGTKNAARSRILTPGNMTQNST
jgi:hypothetical protein